MNHCTMLMKENICLDLSSVQWNILQEIGVNLKLEMKRKGKKIMTIDEVP